MYLLQVIVVLCAFVCAFGQQLAVTESAPELDDSKSLHNGLTERIGNFSVELLYHTAKLQANDLNFILSPITVWTVLAVISEGASGDTVAQINNALRIRTSQRNITRMSFENIYNYLQVNTSTVELAKVNAIFMDQRSLLERDFQTLAQTIYKTRVIPLDFMQTQKTADGINLAVSQFTHGLIPKLVSSDDFSETQMILTSAVYFKGQWSVPFNKSQTTRMPFHNSTGQKTGEVNMMYNRFTYPFSNIKQLQARVLELPYGKENRLSMLIMLPNQGVSLEDMFLNFGKVPLDYVFSELRVSTEEYGDDEVDCYIPRFKIESSLDLSDVLKKNLGIADLFDPKKARLPKLARTPLYVSKVIHKAEMEVTEEGTVAVGVTAAEFSNRIGIVSFIANRPFCYLIIEKITNSIVFGGLYETPSLY